MQHCERRESWYFFILLRCGEVIIGCTYEDFVRIVEAVARCGFVALAFGGALGLGDVVAISGADFVFVARARLGWAATSAALANIEYEKWECRAGAYPHIVRVLGAEARSRRAIILFAVGSADASTRRSTDGAFVRIRRF